MPKLVYVIEYTFNDEAVYWHPDKWVENYQDAMAFETELEAQRHFVRTRRPWCRAMAVPLWPGSAMEHRMKLKSNFVSDAE